MKNEFEHLITNIAAGFRGIDQGVKGPVFTAAVMDGPVVFTKTEISLTSHTTTLDPGAGTALPITPTASDLEIRGILPPSPRSARWLVLYNVSTKNIILKHKDSNAPEANQIEFFKAADVTLNANSVGGVWLLYDTLREHWIQVNEGEPQSSAVDINTTEFTLANSTSETSVYSFALPAGTLASGKYLRMVVIATIENAVGSNTYSIKIALGGTTIISGSVVNGIGNMAASSQRIPVKIVVDIAGLAASQQTVNIEVQVGNGIASATWTAANTKSAWGWNDSLTEDSSTALTLDVLVTQSVADAGNKFNRHAAYILAN